MTNHLDRELSTDDLREMAQYKIMAVTCHVNAQLSHLCTSQIETTIYS